MQCMAHDFRPMCRWRRVDPGDGDDAWSDPGDYYDDGWGDYFE